MFKTLNRLKNLLNKKLKSKNAYNRTSKAIIIE